METFATPLVNYIYIYAELKIYKIELFNIFLKIISFMKNFFYLFLIINIFRK